MARRHSNRSIVVVVSVVLAGCNLVSGASDLVTAESSPIEPPARHDAASVSPVETNDGEAPDVIVQEDAPDAAHDAGVPRPEGGRFVFVTSASSTGDLAGLAGGDARCTTHANEAGLGGSWAAWLSTVGPAGASAIDRVTSAGPWYLVTGVRAVRSKLDLMRGDLEHGIDRDERGALLPSAMVWTGTREGRGFYADCGRWRSASSTEEGVAGDVRRRDPAWSAALPSECNELRRLYCFEN